MLIRQKFYRKAMSLLVMGIFVLQTSLPCFAQSVLGLPVPGAMVAPSAGYVPALIRGITLDPDNPLKFDFIIDTGNSALADNALADESTKLIKYFLASLTVPENELWVNLSPYEKNRIATESFGATEMGRDLLAQDYILKQLSATLTQPDTELGKRYWEEAGTVPVLKGTVPAFSLSKVWIVPDEAVVQEYKNSAFVVKSHLKVMMDRALGSQQAAGLDAGAPATAEEQDAAFQKYILPRIEKEVNEGKNFANLRQIYNSMILAAWFKNNLRQSLLGQVYVDKNKILGVDVDDPQIKEKIYGQYLAAFKKGVYNAIREEEDPVTGESIPRKYFSGGFMGSDLVRKVAGSTVRSQDLKIEPAGKLVNVSSAIVENPPKAPKRISLAWQKAVIGLALAGQMTTAVAPTIGTLAQPISGQTPAVTKVETTVEKKIEKKVIPKVKSPISRTAQKQTPPESAPIKEISAPLITGAPQFNDIFPSETEAENRQISPKMPIAKAFTVKDLTKSFEQTGGRVVWHKNINELKPDTEFVNGGLEFLPNYRVVVHMVGDPNENSKAQIILLSHLLFHANHPLMIFSGDYEFNELIRMIDRTKDPELIAALDDYIDFLRYHYTELGMLLNKFMEGEIDGPAAITKFEEIFIIRDYMRPVSNEIVGIYKGRSPEYDLGSGGRIEINREDYDHLVNILQTKTPTTLNPEDKDFINKIIHYRNNINNAKIWRTEAWAYLLESHIYKKDSDKSPVFRLLHRKATLLGEQIKRFSKVLVFVVRFFKNDGFPNLSQLDNSPLPDPHDLLKEIRDYFNDPRLLDPDEFLSIFKEIRFRIRQLEAQPERLKQAGIPLESVKRLNKFLYEARDTNMINNLGHRGKGAFWGEAGIHLEIPTWQDFAGKPNNVENGYLTEFRALYEMIYKYQGVVPKGDFEKGPLNFQKMIQGQPINIPNPGNFQYPTLPIALIFPSEVDLNSPTFRLDSMSLEARLQVYDFVHRHIRGGLSETYRNEPNDTDFFGRTNAWKKSVRGTMLGEAKRVLGLSNDDIEKRRQEINKTDKPSEEPQKKPEGLSNQTSSVVPAKNDKVGGINFDPALLNLQIKRDPSGKPLPVIQQPIGSMDIQGFYPLIIEIKPVNNLPLLLSSKK